MLCTGELPFKEDTPEKLMAIARDPQLSNSAHVQNLAPAYSTLYELTKLSDKEFAAGC
jgi:hypothetical protein